MKPAEHLAKSASLPKTGLFATLCGLLCGDGSSGPSLASSARRGWLATAVACSVALGVLALGVGSAAAASTAFGEEGEKAGQFRNPYGVAVNQESGDVFVADQHNWRVDSFDGSGSFALAWGWHVNEESPAEELQTCTVFCQSGKPGSGVGTYAEEGPRGIAVDNNSLSSSHGDVYVTDWENHRVQKFGPQGEFLLMFGWEVNEAGGNGCVAGEHCKAGVEGEKEEGMNEDGQFRWAYEGSYIAVGPGGDVYVGDQARVEVFTPAGAWKENIPLSNPEFPGYAKVTALAVDASGDMFLKGEEVQGVRELEPNGTETSTRFDAGAGFSISSIALDAGGDVYVADTEPAFHVLKYDPAGKQLSSFGANTVSFPRGMAFADATGELYVADAEKSDVVVLAAAPSGPVISGESGTPALHGEATFEATINPQGHETTYHFEYLTEQQYSEDGDTFGASTTSTSPATLAATEFEAEEVEAKLPEGTLAPGETYRWRLVASNECEESRTCTADGATQTLEETPSALIDGPWASELTSSTATLAARINPQGAATSYRLEYGTSTAYGHTLTGNAGAGSEPVSVSYHVQELSAATIYHYRVVTENNCYPGKPAEVCKREGADHTFTTLPAVAATVGLPDGRAWELVTPANTGGASLELFSVAARKAASTGGAITYGAAGYPVGEGVESNYSYSPAQVLSRRGPHGWETQDIMPPIGPSPEGGYLPGEISSSNYWLFSTDLASGLLTPKPHHGVLSLEALKGTAYLRNDFACISEPASCYLPLLTPANTPSGTSLEVVEDEGTSNEALIAQLSVLAGTPDLSHIVVASELKLTEDAVEYVPPPKSGEIFRGQGRGNFYVWSGGRLRLVTILPDGRANTEDIAEIAGENHESGQTQRAISDDGRRVAWTVGSPDTEGGTRVSFKGLYVRDMVEDRTVRVGGAFARYQTMSSDGSRVFYLEKGDLYEYHVPPGTPYAAGTTTDLTAGHGAGEASAGVQESVSDVSEDGSSVYFVANGVLGDAAEHGAKAGDCEPTPEPGRTCHLYLLHENGSGTWEPPRFIATLSSEDENSWYSHSILGEPLLERVSSRVSPNGRYLAFMSSRSLTGYDNVDANPAAKGARDEEVFLYDSSTGRLACVSCDPSGARPHGVLSGAGTTPLVQTGGKPEWGEGGHPHWLAGNIPGWENPGGLDNRAYQPRYLSDSGRLFFDSPEPLVAQDTNGLEDAYQYEPAGVGSCAADGGCVSLISSGHSGSESAFMDASENGEDVYFLSSEHLTGADTDTGYDVWDAHACTASSPCLAPPVSPPPCSSGDSCKPAPAPQPELFGPAPSATFSGAGNVSPTPPAATKPLTRAQKLSKALASCRKKYKKARRRRAACERSAHKQFGPAKRATKSAHANRRAPR